MKTSSTLSLVVVVAVSAVLIPAVGLLTIGIGGTLALILERAALVTPTPVSWLVAATPPILLLLGVSLIVGACRRLGWL